MTRIVRLVDWKRRIVDPVMVILRSVEHHDTPFEGIGILRIVEIALPEILA